MGGARTAERMMPPLTQTASEAFWGRSFSAADASSSGRGNQTTSSRLDDDDDVVVLLSDETNASEAAPLISHNALKLAFCGGVSGALAKTCTAPLARLTILYQVKGLAVAGAGLGGPQLGMFAALRHIAATEGVCALWKGNLVTIMHRIPYSATNFYTYESMKRALRGHLPNESARAWAAGAISGLVACTAAYPLDLLRTRIAAETSPRCNSIPNRAGAAAAACGPRSLLGPYMQQYHQHQQRRPHLLRVPHTLRSIVEQQGVRGLYKGLGATLVQVVPGLAFNFCFYDTFKTLALHLQQQHREQQQQPLALQPCQQVKCQGSLAIPCQPDQLGQEEHHEQQLCQTGVGELCCDSVDCGRTSDAGAAGAAAAGASTAAPPLAAPASPSPLTSAACACLSGLCTSTLTFPLDVVRRRLQVYERGALGRLRYLDVVRAVYSEGGVAAFYRGLGAEFAKVLPGMAIAFTTYETMKRLTGVS